MGVMVQNKVARFLWLTVYIQSVCTGWAAGIRRHANASSSVPFPYNKLHPVTTVHCLQHLRNKRRRINT